MPVTVDAPDFISSEILAGLFTALCALVVVVLTGSYHKKTRSFSLFCYAELVMCISRAVYVAIPDGLTGGDVPALPKNTLGYWLNFASFALFLIGNGASIIAWLVILHMFVKVCAGRRPALSSWQCCTRRGCACGKDNLRSRTIPDRRFTSRRRTRDRLRYRSP